MKPSFDHLSKYRVHVGPMGSTDSLGRYGAFLIPYKSNLIILEATAAEGTDELTAGWEHVSVRARIKGSKRARCPTWEEMCYIKDLFWEPSETVIQFHPPESKAINMHPSVLHLWKPNFTIALPPTDLV
jgi:hypothetical protein